jgi:DNA-binding response OmpR family regulator
MSSQRKNPTILVVDDEPDIVGMVLAILQLGDFEAVGASNVDEALSLATARVPDAIILDRNLEDSQCGELVARLAADPTTAHIPILLMTADADGDQVALALGAGVTGAIRKPFEPEALLNKLRSVFPAAGSAPANRAAAASGVRPRVAAGADSHTADANEPSGVDLLIVTSDAATSAALDAVAQRRSLATRHATSFREAVEAARRWRPRSIALEVAVSKAKTMELVRTLRAQQHSAGDLPVAAHTRVQPVLLLGAANDLDARLAIVGLEATVFLAATRNQDQLDRALGRLFAFSWTPGSVLLVGPGSELVRDTLRGHGFEVTHVADPIAAFAVVASGVDVVLVDERVHGVSPIDLCGALARSADAKLRSVVLLSRRPDEETRRAALRAGADEVLGPRESAEGVVACVRRRLERMRAAADVAGTSESKHELEHPAHAHAGAAQRRVR